MDYAAQGLPFKIRKVLRYVRLYGPRRTWVKVQGLRHMKRRYTRLPAAASRAAGGRHVGIIGCGNFAYTTIAYYLRRNYGRVIHTCMDIDVDRAASLCRKYSGLRFSDDADEVLNDPRIDLVFIASNHASHAEYAIRALEAGKAVHIEKPHCVDEDQLRRLCAAISATGGKVAIGFNRPGSDFGARIRRHLDTQPGAAMLNWFLAGHRIDPDHWYFRPEEGGRVLGNLCHWTDFVYRLVPPDGRFPIAVTPTRHLGSDSDFAVTYGFADGSIAAITFSAKGHTFEGVRERFAAHKGEVLIAMDDFQTLTIDLGHQKRKYSLWFRDHGHERRICRSYEMVRGGAAGDPVSYVWESGLLFLRTRDALDADRPLTVRSFAESYRPGG